MGTDELTRLMHDGAARQPQTSPDLAGIRRLGRRRRRGQRLALAGSAVAVLAIVGGAIALLPGGSGGTDHVLPAAQDDHATGLTAYEKRVLREVPRSYAVDGTVIVPGTIGSGKEGGAVADSSDSRLVLAGPVIPLGFHSYTQPGYVPSSTRYPKFMYGNQPKGVQVKADNGTSFLTCGRLLREGKKDTKQCQPVIAVKDSAGRLQFLYGIGADDFLDPGSAMETFIDDDYQGRVHRPTIIGGFDGTSAVSVVLTLTDGRRVDAAVDSGGLSKGDTLFWARTPAAVATVTAYDASGKVVDSHKIRACKGGVDCEVR